MALADRINSSARKLPNWIVYVAGIAPAFWLFYLGATGGLGMEPIEELEHRYGLLALQFLIASLCITPLRKHANLSLLKFRRPLGLIAFFYLSAHLSVWLFLDVGDLDEILSDIAKRPYITIGMVGFVLLIPLAATSSNWSIRKLGPLRWRRIHRLVYPAIFLGALHFVMLRKGWQLEPLLYFAAIVGLLGLRVPWMRLVPAWSRRTSS